MQQLVLDRAIRSKLRGWDELAQVRDEAGRVIGHFVPSQKSSPNRQCPYSDEEVEALRRQTGGRSLAEILADLDQQP